MILQIFLPCFFGTQLSTASEKLSDSVFHSDWKKRDKKFKTAMVMFMENTKRPIKVSVLGGLISIEFATFTSVCNLAYSFYAVFKKINL
jgi:hypothetical protein